MASYHGNANQGNGRVCICCGCGKRITLLESQKSLAHFFGEITAQRRGFRCMNCGEVTCVECRHHDCYCLCQSNAWVALPYLEKSGTDGYPDTL